MTDYLPWIPERFKKGFMRRILLSVHTEIHRQIGELRERGVEPTIIKLGPVCSRRFCYEAGTGNLRMDPKLGPTEYLGIPIQYNHQREGVYVE